MKPLGSLFLATATITATAFAHHSPTAFNVDAQITIQGRISRVDWTSPHTYVYVEGASAAGRTAEWMLETDAVPILTRSGWTRQALAVGTPVTVRANPDRNADRNHGLIVSLALPNGTVLSPRSETGARGARATGIAGVWNGLRGFALRRVGALKPTPKGLAAMQAYTVAANPVTNCTPYTAPFLGSLPYLNEIVVRNDRIEIRNEFLNVDRTIYMDGRAHPANGPRTLQGHSIGRWEGDVLVVDSRLFADHLLGNYTGSGKELRELPSGPRKHLVERYQVSDDRTRLLISTVVEDPDYLAEPLTMTMEWDYTPQLRLLRFGCDPQQSQRYLFR
jgi:hypothetical protein